MGSHWHQYSGMYILGFYFPALEHLARSGTFKVPWAVNVQGAWVYSDFLIGRANLKNLQVVGLRLYAQFVSRHLDLGDAIMTLSMVRTG
jgi:hypothetical protein